MISHPPFPDKQYQILYADPPWDYKGQLQYTGVGGQDSGGAIRHYPTISVKEMLDWNIASISSDNCLLFMWSSSPHLDQAIRLGKAWGFRWATVAFVWDKCRVNPGFYTMSQCELCLVFKRGTIPQPRGLRNIRQFVQAKRTRHSEKPDEVRQRIEEMFPEQSKLELFARKEAEGWDVWGLEIKSNDSKEL